MIKQFLEWIVVQLNKEATYQQFAEFTLRIARVLFSEATEFIEELVEKHQKRIERAKSEGKDQEYIDKMKKDAAQVVDKVAVREFSASPTYVPGFVRRGIRDSKAYLLNHPEDIRNDRAREHGFFRQHDENEIKESVEALNRGFIGR